jgi:hypothetical protein
MRMEQETLERLINKMIKHIKPNGVSKLIYELRPADDTGDEYYMRVTYVVPDDSKYLKVNPDRNSIPVRYRYEWNHEIQKTIKDYFAIGIIISNSGTQSESYYERQKKYQDE